MKSGKNFPDIRVWSSKLKENPYLTNCTAVSKDGHKILIDPVFLNADGLAELEKAGPYDAIYLSNKNHEDAAEEFKKKLKTPVWIHEQDAEFLKNKPDAIFCDGQRLLCDIKAVHLHAQKSPGESVFYLESQKTLIGSALMGYPAGSLNIPADNEYADVRKAQAGLRRLFSLNFESFFVSCGESVLNDAYNKLEDCFERLR